MALRSAVLSLARRSLARTATTAGTVSLEPEGVFDGERLVLHHESRYLCRCEKCFGRASNQPLHTTDFSHVRVEGVGGTGEHFVELQWDDGHSGFVPRTPVGAYGQGTKPTPTQRHYDLSLRRNAVQTFWDKPSPSLLKKFDYGDVTSNPDKVKEFLAHFMEHGLAFLSGTPHQPGDILNVLDKLEVGPYWENMFGTVSRVTFMNDPSNQAFNNNHLDLHTDMPYYTQTPSAYFFHCLSNELEGGESFWADSFSAVREIRDKRPDHYALLTEVPIPFRQYATGWHMAGSYPTVELLNGDLYRVRDCLFVIDTFQMVRDHPAELRAAWWEAYNHLRALVNAPGRSVQVKLESGDLVVIDNWRVQHARNAFTVTADSEGKSRAMEVVYVEWNHVQNRLLRSDAQTKPLLSS